MIEAMWSGLQQATSLEIIGLMVLATFIGNFFGAVPGLGGNLGLALLIPFVFGWEPFAGLAFLLAMHSVVHTGGSIPGIQGLQCPHRHRDYPGNGLVGGHPDALLLSANFRV